MARTNDRDRKRAVKDTRPRGKKRVCIFCQDDIAWVDYKDVNLLRRFMSDRGKIRARRVTGTCAQHQREVAVAIKTARELTLLPYSQRTVSERGPSRSGGRPGGAREPQASGAEACGAEASGAEASAVEGPGDNGIDFDDLPEARELERVGAGA
jgi:small subunit ribosomal protein S18